MKYLTILSLLFLFSCSHIQSNRKLANTTSFKCKFKYQTNSENYNFNFMPDEQTLVVNSESKEYQIKVDESDFSAGGFLYKSDNTNTDWNLNVDFKSNQNPTITIIFANSPLFQKNQVIRKNCE